MQIFACLEDFIFVDTIILLATVDQNPSQCAFLSCFPQYNFSHLIVSLNFQSYLGLFSFGLNF